MPILWVIGAIGFSFKYWVEKYVVIKFYTQPPLYDYDVFEYWSPNRTTTWAVIFHAVAGTILDGFVGGRYTMKPLIFEWLKPHCVLFWGLLLLSSVAAMITVCPCNKQFFGRKEGKMWKHEGDENGDAAEVNGSQAAEGGRLLNPQPDTSLDIDNDDDDEDDDDDDEDDDEDDDASSGGNLNASDSSDESSPSSRYSHDMRRLPFSTAYDTGLIVNKDKHYARPALMQVRAFQTAFLDALKEEEDAHINRKKSSSSLGLHLEGLGVPSAAARGYLQELSDAGIETVQRFDTVSSEMLGDRFGFDKDHVAAVVKYRASQVRATAAAAAAASSRQRIPTREAAAEAAALCPMPYYVIKAIWNAAAPDKSESGVKLSGDGAEMDQRDNVDSVGNDAANGMVRQTHYALTLTRTRQHVSFHLVSHLARCCDRPVRMWSAAASFQS